MPANRLSSPNDRAESLLLTSIGKLNLSATFYSRESLRYFVKCLQGARLEIPIVLDNHAILYPGPHNQSLTLNDIAGPRGPGPGAHENPAPNPAGSGMARESLNIFTIRMNNFKITMWLCESN